MTASGGWPVIPEPDLDQLVDGDRLGIFQIRVLTSMNSHGRSRVALRPPDTPPTG